MGGAAASGLSRAGVLAGTGGDRLAARAAWGAAEPTRVTGLVVPGYPTYAAPGGPAVALLGRSGRAQTDGPRHLGGSGV